MKKEKLLIVTFVVTALYDVLLRSILETDIWPELFTKPIKESDWGKSLIPYFKHHTLLAAALIAGFVGAITQPFISCFLRTWPKKINELPTFLTITFIVSAFMGFFMKASLLFPILQKTYYKDLGQIRAAYTDGISGIIVNMTIFGLCYLRFLEL